MFQKYRFGLAVIGSCSPLSSIVAQPIPLEVQREAQRIQDREIERQNAAERDFFRSQSPIRNYTIEPEAAAEAGEVGRCRAISRVSLEGITRFEARRFTSLLAGATGACVSPATLSNIARQITNSYIARGFVTSRAFIIPDAANPMVLTVKVVEGRILAVTSEGSAGTSDQGYLPSEIDFAFGPIRNRHLNLRSLEQGVDQLVRLPSASPQIDILPSAKPGFSDLIVRRYRAGPRIRPSMSISNDGSKSTGRELMTIALDLDSDLGIADHLSLYGFHDIASGARKKTFGGGGFFSVPLAKNLFSLSFNYSRYQSILTSNDLQFSNDGRTFSGFVAIDRLIARNKSQKFNVTLQLSGFDTAARIQDIRLSTGSYRLFTGSLRGVLQSRLKDGVIVTDLAYVQGLNILGAASANFGPDGPKRTFSKLEAGVAARFTYPVGQLALGYAGSIRGQWAVRPLLAAERLSIGSASTVRGFRDDGASGDFGLFARSQLTLPLFTAFKEKKSAHNVRFSAFAGQDLGFVGAAKGNAEDRVFLQSFHAGLTASSRRLSAEFIAARAVNQPEYFQPPQFEFSASIRLSV